MGEIGWSLGEVTSEHSDGWVAWRGLAGQGSVDQVEVGVLSDALAPGADLSESARRLLDQAALSGTPAVAVHITPSRLAG